MESLHRSASSRIAPFGEGRPASWTFSFCQFEWKMHCHYSAERSRHRLLVASSSPSPSRYIALVDVNCELNSELNYLLSGSSASCNHVRPELADRHRRSADGDKSPQLISDLESRSLRGRKLLKQNHDRYL